MNWLEKSATVFPVGVAMCASLFYSVVKDDNLGDTLNSLAQKFRELHYPSTGESAQSYRTLSKVGGHNSLQAYHPVSFATKDFNNDGELDYLVITNTSTHSASGNIGFIDGRLVSKSDDGKPVFHIKPIYIQGATIPFNLDNSQIKCHDYDGDGQWDLRIYAPNRKSFRQFNDIFKGSSLEVNHHYDLRTVMRERIKW